MNRNLWISTALLFMTSLAFAGPKGTVPKTNLLGYPAHGTNEAVAVGARLIASDEARKTFSSDVNRCCVVVEVAVYPHADKSSDVSLNDFVLQVKSAETAAKPSSAKVIAASLQKKARDERDVNVSPTVGVGYGTAYDPVYGPTGSGVYSTAVVGVSRTPRGMQPGSTEKDRAAMETELSEKGLPEGSTAAPVAGYLYFTLPRDKKASYQLEYLTGGQKIVLALN